MPGQPVPFPRPVRKSSTRSSKNAVNPDVNPIVIDAPGALRASPDDVPGDVVGEKPSSESSLSDVPELEPPKKRGKVGKQATAVLRNVASKPEKIPAKAKGDEKEEIRGDPEAEGVDDEVDPEEMIAAARRPPPVNSDYLPLPWKGRLGYACLNTYLRNSNPPVFSSRTTRIASIIEHRHPLKDPSQPEHATKNRPDKEQPPDIGRGRRFVEALGLANARDIIKMIRWNERYGIKFMRLSSEMFPFASHEEYGYKLAPFAVDVLGEAGKVIARLGHRVTTHPGQFTQLGSPRKQVIDSAIRDLAYHDEMLSLLRLPEQMDRDAVTVLHMGGAFGDKAATLDRFRENYKKLPQSIKNRIVLENDDVIWSVHDLLPVCQELNIPLVLDWHHHNIIFDADKLREGTHDISTMVPTILETWTRKGITPKMHYSEQTAPAITGRQRRKHSARVMTFPPCPADMDLMIEAKDKEQACFELMRTFKLPGWNTFADIIPHVREDDNKPAPVRKKATTKKKKTKNQVQEEEDGAAALEVNGDPYKPGPPPVIPDEEVGMGGPLGRVYWPVGMEEWLRPKKREIKKKTDDGEAAPLTPAQKRKAAAAEKEKTEANGVHKEADAIAPEQDATGGKKKKGAAKSGGRKAAAAATAANGTTTNGVAPHPTAAIEPLEPPPPPPPPPTKNPKRGAASAAKSKAAAAAAARERDATESGLSSSPEAMDLDDDDDDDKKPVAKPSSTPSEKPVANTRKSSRAQAAKQVNYAVDGEQSE